MRRTSKQPRHAIPIHHPPLPFGASAGPDGVQFNIFSRHATRVWLMLFDSPGQEIPTREIMLHPYRNRLGDLWHIHVPEARAGQFYAYRMNGDHRTRAGRFFNPSQWLLDPCALAVAGRPRWGDAAGTLPGTRPTCGADFPKSVIVDSQFDWSGDVSLRIPLQDTVIYETHLRGFTAHGTAGVNSPGTYKGFMEKIPYLQALGITAVELLPVQEFNEMEYHQEDDARRGLRNYWGYSTVGFYAPNGRYAHEGVQGAQVREFKELVLALHRAGIEVLLDVVLNHTAEGGIAGPVYSFRGIDDTIYYMCDGEKAHYRNYSGCGNTVNCNHPVVRAFILDCLRYWIREMHVDGFRFDLASVLTRDTSGEILDRPPLVEEISEDPVLRHAKLIAEPWDAGGAYQVGTFPGSGWSEWNGKYRDDIRRFWKGQDGKLGAFAQRLTGSADLYNKPGGSPLNSVNFVTCHDGFTLRDMVSYNQKHNLENGEENRDGEDHNDSYNFGVEGPCDDPAVQASRIRQTKNFIGTLLLSQGVPMLLAGDEFGQSQQGNNNAYCQDNVTSWLDWSLLEREQGLFHFTQQAIALRKKVAQLRRNRFFSGTRDACSGPDIHWYDPDGNAPAWNHGKALAFSLPARTRQERSPHPSPALFAAFNAGDEPVSFHVPGATSAAWRLALHSESDPPAWNADKGILSLGIRALAVLLSEPGPGTLSD
jgi:isoamylase